MTVIGQDRDLNLLPSQAKFQAALIKLKIKAKKVSQIIITIWVLVLAVVLLSWLLTKLWLQLENKKYKKAVDAYLALSERVIASQLVKYRAKLLGMVLASRFEYSSAFNRIGNLFGPEVTVDSFEIIKQSSFDMAIKVPRGEILDRVEKQIDEINNGSDEMIKKIEMKGISYSRATRDWVMSLKIDLK